MKLCSSFKFGMHLTRILNGHSLLSQAEEVSICVLTDKIDQINKTLNRNKFNTAESLKGERSLIS